MAAEAIVSLAIDRISGLLIHEALFLEGVKEQAECLMAELKRMQCFFKDVDRKPEQDDRLRNRVSEIRDLAYDAEDVIDSFILERAHQGVFKRFTSIFTKPFHQHKIGVKIKAIRAKLENISRSLPAYEIPGDGAGSSSVSIMQQRLRRTFSHVEEDDVVNLEVSTKDVLAQLMTEEDRVHAIVSIVGMGGIGKTTLARKVYNHDDVKRRFDCLAWISISQQCNPGEVLHDILMKVQPRGESIDNLTESQLIKRLSYVLKEKLYLVVFDDIWRSEDWDILKPAFPRGKKGSKILFTTRIKDAALHADPRHSPIELPFLTDDESWNLLSRKAFPGNKTDSYACSEAFEKLGREMVKKCGGLPLAIVVLGGLLAAKPTQGQWEMVHRNIFQGHLKGFQQQGQQYGAVNAILALSYNDLPYHLKPCFLYLGHYPEDWEISKNELIRLWIAEGLISPSLESRDMLMEDVGEQFLEELMNRSLVQLGRLDYTGTNVETCRIHDLLRDLCIEKAKEEKFLEIVQPRMTEFDMKLAEPMLRRIAIHPSQRSVSLKGKHKKLRSLLLFQNVELILLEISECKKFKFLRVLNLVRKRGKWRVSSEIGNLHHLRYLKLEGDEIILPLAMGRLKSLHTLYIRYWMHLSIPNAVFDLEHLRHIILRERLFVTETRCLLPRLTSKNIETLKYIAVDKKLIETDALRRLVYIQRLGMTFKRAEDVKPILMLLTGLRRLGSLSLSFLGNFASYSDLEPLSHCNRLSKLKLTGEINEDPHQSHHVLKFLPPNIVKLTLMACWMEQDPMCVLEKLPCLRILKFQGTVYMGTKMICSANGFPQLDYLEMKRLLELEEWEIEEGAMPQLRSLHLGMFLKLKMIPEGLKYITTVQELKLVGMGSLLEGRVKVINGREGEDFYKVRHIPSVQIIRY